MQSVLFSQIDHFTQREDTELQLKCFENSLPVLANIAQSKDRGKDATIITDVIVSSFIGSGESCLTHQQIRTATKRGFDYDCYKKRKGNRESFDSGDLGALVDSNKWKTSGNGWDDEAISLFRSFFTYPSPAIQVDTLGRKINYTDFDGKDHYDFVYSLTDASNLKNFLIWIYHCCLNNTPIFHSFLIIN